MRWYLIPFSIIYGLIVNLRNKLFDLELIKSTAFDIPIISVGNISVGGTGKTPHTEFLIEWLKTKYKVSTLSRGYKRKTRGFVEVTTNAKVKDVGDEALQVKQKYPDVKVVVDEKRVHGVQQLLKNERPSEVIILDDAYQHRHIEPGINILLIDYNRPITKDFLLPVGRLREPALNKKRANIVILTKCPRVLNPIDFRIMHKELNLYSYQELFFTTFTYAQLKPVYSDKLNITSLSDLKNKTILCITGIANPTTLYTEIENNGAEIIKMPFADHHEFTAANVHKIYNRFNAIKNNDKLILCTEKDAVKFKSALTDTVLNKVPFYYVPVQVKFLNNEEIKFKNIITKFISRYYN